MGPRQRSTALPECENANGGAAPTPSSGPELHSPLWQVSFAVQASPSSQGIPFGTSTLTVEGVEALKPVRHTTVGDRIRVASSSVDRSMGLLRTPEVKQGEGLWIERSPSIHMFFMRYAIDAVFIDERLQVVKVVETLRPWRMARGGKHAHSVLELPPGKAAFFNIRVGDKLTIIPT